MTEKEWLDQKIADGFLPQMILRDPTPDELRKLPEIFRGPTTKALPLRHPDGRKLMCYLITPETIKYAESLVKDAWTVIGYRLVIYCSGVGPDTIHGHKLNLDHIVGDLRQRFGWEVVTSSFPHTFEVTFDIEGDDRQAIKDYQDRLQRVALALSLRSQIGFTATKLSPGTRYKGQPFALTFGIDERSVRAANAQQLEYVDHIWEDEEAFEAATALQDFYSQVNDNAKITTGWAAIEHTFGTPAEHLLTQAELDTVANGIEQMDHLSLDKRTQLLERIRNPEVISREGRNARIARSISDLLKMDFDEIYDKVRSMTHERARRVHRIADHAPLLKAHVEFVEKVLWAIIGSRIACANPFDKSCVR